MTRDTDRTREAIARIAAVTALSLDGAAACEAAAARAEAASCPWHVVLIGGDRPPDGLRWLHPGVEVRASGGGGSEARPGGDALTIVGIDGAPLWRVHDYDVPQLRALGFEPEGVRRFVAPPGAAAGDRGDRGERVRFFSLAALERQNREALLALDPRERRRRLARALEDGAIRLEWASLDLAWVAIRPRVRRLGEAPERLAFLRDGFTPERAEGDRGALARAAARCDLEAGPAELIARLSAGGGESARWRRVVRWALTGQSIAPPLEIVWALLDPAELRRRLGCVP